MVGRIALAFFAAWTLTLTSPAFPEPYVLAINIGAGALPSSLEDLQRQTGIELLFDSRLVSGLQSPAVQGHLTTEAALRQLLTETDLIARQAESGAWIVERRDAAPVAQQDAVIPEILVIGARTHNADIRRFENDVQPYTVVTQAKLARAHRDNVDQYFNSRITANTQVRPAGWSRNGDTLSAIDLRGLGSNDTLVLIDGRRMPSIPDPGSGFRQADLNAVPVHAIKRIEVLTGAAGGIHGFGALGGVVNVVLDRDSRGLDVHLTQGISSRGDAGRQAVEAGFGHTSTDGRTDLVLFASHSESDPLLAGERDYELRDRRLNAQFVGTPDLVNPPRGNSISVFSLGSNLVFKPEFGGATLSSDHTFMPTGFSGDSAALAASLAQHAGQVDFSLSEGDANSDLGSNPRSDSLLVNVRHRFGERWEAYADALVLRSRGQSTNRSGYARVFMSPASPANPFTDFIFLAFPVQGMGQQVARRVESRRYTAGLVADLPFDWRGTLEASSGSLLSDTSTSVAAPNPDLLLLFGDPSDIDMNPLGDWDRFEQAIAANVSRFSRSFHFHTRFRDGSLRLAGPVFDTAAGPATLTLLAERRTDEVPASTQFDTLGNDATTSTSATRLNSRSSATTSLYAELSSRLALLRGLELQLAVRHDEQADDFARQPFGTDDGGRIHADFAGTAYTVGAKLAPLQWLTLRGSYATGEQPPPPGVLRELDETSLETTITADPKRGGANLGVDGPLLWKSGGYAGLTTVRANTACVGAIFTPLGGAGPRLAIDYSRIRKSRDVTSLSQQLVMEHEDFWPQRVTRAALTDADRAQGHTAGRVIRLDTRDMNGASVEVDALDVHADWPLPFLSGRLELYADATHQMNNRSKAPFQPDVQNAGYLNGPLKWRANGGFDWSTDRLTIGANLQYFDDRLVLQQGIGAFDNEGAVTAQGSQRIPSQTYLDLHASWRLPLRNSVRARELAVDLGIVNVLDRAPPRESSMIPQGLGYSRYGDPRQRRFELVLSGHF